MQKDKRILNKFKKSAKGFSLYKVSVLVAVIILAVILAVMVVNSVHVLKKDEPVKFSNNKVETAIEKALNDRHITYEEALTVKELNLYDCKVMKDLTDLECFENLEVLVIEQSGLTTLEGIQNFEKLVTLNCTSNRISDISQLYEAELPELKTLILKNNQIRSIDMILTELNTLEACDISYNKIYGQVNLGKSDKLLRMVIMGNGIEGVTGEAPAMEKLLLESNNISSLSYVDKFENLKELSLRGNLLTEINGVSEFPALEYLDIRDNKITDISELSEVEFLNSIYIDEEIDRNQLNFIVDNFRAGDFYTKQYVLQLRHDLDVK